MKKRMVCVGLLILLVFAGPAEAVKNKKIKGEGDLGRADLSSVSDKGLIAILDSDPEKREQYKQRFQAQREILLRGGTPEIISGLIGICEEGPSQQTRMAMEILVSLRAKEVIPVLTYYLRHNDSTSWIGISLDGLQKIHDPQSSEEVAKFYHEDDKAPWRGPAMEVLGKTGDAALVPEFQEKLKDFNLGDTAALVLAEMGDISGRETARRFLSQSRHGLDLTALKALGVIGDKGDLGLVDDMVRKFPNEADWGDIARFQIEAHGLPSASKIEKLGALLDTRLSARHDRMAEWAVDWLSEEGSAPALEELGKIATGSVPFQLRLLAVQALRSHGYRVTYEKGGMDYTFQVEAPTVGAVPAGLVRVFHPPSAEVAAATTESPGAVEPSGDISKLTDEALIGAFKDESEGDAHYEDRDPAHLEILARGKDPALLGGLLDILRTGSLTQKGHAAMLAGELNASEAVPELVQALEDRDIWDKLAFWPVLKSLGILGGPEAVEALTGVYEFANPKLSDHGSHSYPMVSHSPGTRFIALDDNICATALYGLAQLHQTQIIPQLRIVFQQNDRRFSAQAARAMAQLGEDVGVRDWARKVLDKSGNLDFFTAGAAIEALGFIGDGGDMDLIKELEQDKSVWSKFPSQITAAKYLIGMKRQPLSTQVKYVSYFLDKKSMYMVPWAIQWLGDNGSPEAVAELNKVINDPGLEKYQLDILIQLRRDGMAMTRVQKGDGTFLFAPSR